MSKKKLPIKEYEVDLEWIGEGDTPKYLENEYGFGYNPPIVVHAKSITDVKKQLSLPSSIKIKKIAKVL